MVSPVESAGIDFDKLVNSVKDLRAVAEWKLRDIDGSTNGNHG